MERNTAKNPHLLQIIAEIMINPPTTAEINRGKRSGYLLKLYLFFNYSDSSDNKVRGHKYFEISETML